MANICTRVFLPAMMIVEMGNQMKDLHTLLHYLPIIRTSSLGTKFDTSMGDGSDFDILPSERTLRKIIPHPAMGKARSMFPQRLEPSASPLE